MTDNGNGQAIKAPPVAVPNNIPSFEELSNITPMMRLNWKVNDIVSKAIHKMFLLVNHDDVIVIHGEHYDYSALDLAAQAISAAGWCTAVLRKPELDGCCKMVIATSPAGLTHVGAQPTQEAINAGNGQADTTRQAEDTITGTTTPETIDTQSAARPTGGN